VAPRVSSRPLKLRLLSRHLVRSGVTTFSHASWWVYTAHPHSLDSDRLSWTEAVDLARNRPVFRLLDWMNGPGFSADTGRKTYCALRSTYLAVFLSAAWSATSPAPVPAVSTYDPASLLATVMLCAQANDDDHGWVIHPQILTDWTSEPPATTVGPASWWKNATVTTIIYAGDTRSRNLREKFLRTFVTVSWSTTTTLWPITLHGSCHMPDSFCPIVCKKLVPEKNLYKIDRHTCKFLALGDLHKFLVQVSWACVASITILSCESIGKHLIPV